MTYAGSKKKILICLPFAGGSASYYSTWQKQLDNPIELVTPELAGRGKRFHDKFYSSFDDAVSDLYTRVEPYINDAAYAFFGHSMGALLSYELVMKIQSLNKPTPFHAFISGHPVPHQIDRELVYNLSEQDFINYIKNLGGMPKEFFEFPDAMKLFMPVMRADFTILDLYKMKRPAKKLTCDMTVFNGLQDHYTMKGTMSAWEEYTTGKYDIYHFEGDHFFINNHKAEIIRIINQTFCKHLYPINEPFNA